MPGRMETRKSCNPPALLVVAGLLPPDHPNRAEQMARLGIMGIRVFTAFSCVDSGRALSFGDRRS
jgi:hypothetical protein